MKEKCTTKNGEKFNVHTVNNWNHQISTKKTPTIEAVSIKRKENAGHQHFLQSLEGGFLCNRCGRARCFPRTLSIVSMTMPVTWNLTLTIAEGWSREQCGYKHLEWGLWSHVLFVDEKLQNRSHASLKPCENAMQNFGWTIQPNKWSRKTPHPHQHSSVSRPTNTCRVESIRSIK